MANNKKNINELVTDDDDPTAELEVLSTGKVPPLKEEQNLSESAAITDGFVNASDDEREAAIEELKSDLEARSETIARLQFDIEQLHARWTGLETEIKAREELTERMNVELTSTTGKLARKEELLKKRDKKVKALKARIRQRDDDHSELMATIIQHEQRIEALDKELTVERKEEKEKSRKVLEKQSGQMASTESTILRLRAQLERNESYADGLRQQLHDHTTTKDDAENTQQMLQFNLDQASVEVAGLKASLDAEETLNEELSTKLDGLRDAHAAEIRVIRFELGESQETIAKHELLAEQLTSDLVHNRESRIALESKHSDSEDLSSSQIEKLEQENRQLLNDAEESKEELETKRDAINCLLAELAKKSRQFESIDKIENVIQDIDSRMSERIDERSGSDRGRVTRVLIGSVDGQDLRFPLFKDRLTIGRTEQNDIQLDASYVSRRHAVVVTERNVTRIIDWGSKNGVFVNSKRISEHFLKSGDTVTVGCADFRYEERPKRNA